MANVTVNGISYSGVNEVRLPITDGGGSEQSFVLPPSGTKNIIANGNGIDVADYAAVNVNVPTGITPTGTKNISQNGDYDVTQFANAHVNVSGEVPTLQQKSVTAPASGTTDVTPDSGYDGLSKVTVSSTPTETKTINANGTYTPSSGKHFSQVTVNVSGGGTTYDYVKQQKEVTDAFALFTMKTDAKPEHVELHITTNNSNYPAGWYVDFSFDFPTGTDFLQVDAQDDGGYNFGIQASRSQYGFAFDLFYTETQGSTNYKPWMSSTVSDRAIIDATVYSNQPVYEAFEPASGFWRTDGKRILDSNGNVVVINGIGMAANDFLAETTKDAPATWQISNETIAEVASLGFNSIRLYFGYQLFEDDNNPGVYKQSGWTWFDTILGWAAAHGVKVILNMHCPPPAVQYSPSEESYKFWLEDQYGYQQRTINLWAAIANRYKNNTAIIGYGIVNELHLKLYNYSLASTQCVMSDLFQRIINAIRTVDTNHMIFAERGLWWYVDEEYEEMFPGWSSTRINVNESFVYYPCLADSQLVCEHHDYQGRPTRDSSTGTVTPGESKSWMIAAMEKTNDLFERLYGNDAPIYIGEYGCLWGYDSSDEDFLRWTQDMHDICMEKGIAHNLHTYYGWHKGSGTYNSMGLRYVTSWHGSATSGTLYEALADIFSASPEIVLQDKTITENGSYTADDGYDGLGTVTVNVSGDTPQTQEKTVSPSTSQQVVTPDSGKLLSKVTVNAIQTETKSATPSESAQTITPTSGKYLTGVDIGAISSTYVGSGVTRKSAQNYTPGTSNQTIAASQYLSGAQTILGDANLIASNIKNGVSIFGVNGTYSGSVDTANMYAGSTTPSTANVDDLWVDTSDEVSDLFKSWDITVSSKKTSDYTLVSGDSWIQQHYANDTIMLLLVGTKISHANSEVILSLATNGKVFAKPPNNDELIGLRSYVSSSGGISNGIVTASNVSTAAFALKITSNGNVSIRLASSNPLNVGTYCLYGWIIEGGFTN